MSKRNVLAADLAETIISPEYRSACDTAYDKAPSDGVYVDTKDLLYGAMAAAYSSTHGRNKTIRRSWEARRLFTLWSLESSTPVDPSLFGQYVTGLGGSNIPLELTSEDLPKGRLGAIKTNDMIKSSNRLSNDPAEFLDDVVRTIDERSGLSPANVGPENYCTGLKYFVDKVQDDIGDITGNESVMQNIRYMLDGYFEVSEKDKPNFIELTNLLYSIRALPEGIVGQEHTGLLIKQLLEELPNLTRPALNVLIEAFPKLDLGEFGEQAAVVIDLAIRQRGQLERSRELIGALKAIRKLPPCDATVSSFNALFDLSNNIEEEALDIFDLDFMNDSLYAITADNDTNPELAIRAKEIAFNAAHRAVNLLHQKKGNVTQETFFDLKSIVQRTADNYKKI